MSHIQLYQRAIKHAAQSARLGQRSGARYWRKRANIHLDNATLHGPDARSQHKA